ncbi:hypothetical protein A4D02_34890 [Niastella koreensis]|nr:hypothetical protein A4D02_34890 [Niastella koreensis]
MLITLCVKVSFAQKKADIGFKAGLSIPNLTTGSSNNSISSGYNSRLDVHAAVHIEYRMGDRFSIQPQLEYSSQGGKKDGIQTFSTPDNLSQQFPPGQAPTYLYADYKSEARLNYLMLPVLAKYHFMSSKKWDAYLAAGPFVSYLLSAKNITKGSSLIYLDEGKTQPLGPEAQSFDNTENITSDLHRFNAGINGHAGIGYKLSNGSIFLEAGGNYGLIDIQKSAADGKNKAGAAVIDLGYQFRL